MIMCNEKLTEAQSVDPIIFRGLKSITLDNTQQQSLLRLAAEGISVSF
jgi:putative NIF3 family GTP cyclohydrolase 1 type 2